jgi:L-asparagine oxygenase
MNAPARQTQGLPLPYQMRLTSGERMKLLAVAQRLASFPPALVDHHDWVAEARRLSCHLPTRMLEMIRHYRNDPGSDGMMVLSGLPIDPRALPDTPAVRDSAERHASIPSSIAMLIAEQLGEVIAYRAEKNGALVQNVVPVRELSASQSNAGNVELEFHTENAFHPQRPHYVGLICLRPDHRGSAAVRIVSIRRLIPLLDDHTKDILKQTRFVTDAPPSFHSPARTEPHAVLGGTSDDPDIRVDFSATQPLDAQSSTALDRLRLAAVRSATSLVLHPGDMVILDNRVTLHGRTEFAPRYDGRDRWLHRVFIHLDNRQNRPHRSQRGSVLA